MVVNDDGIGLALCGVLGFFASRLAPTSGQSRASPIEARQGVIAALGRFAAELP